MRLRIGKYALGPQTASAAWTLLGTGVSRGAIIVSNVYVARHVAQAEFGGLGIIQSTVTMLGVLAGFGLGMAATKFIAERRVADAHAVGSALGVCHSAALILGGLLALAQFSLSGWIARDIFADARLIPLLRASSALIALNAINSVQVSSLIGFEEFPLLAKVGTLAGVVTILAVVGLTSMYGVLGAIWGLTVALGTTVLATHLVLRTLSARTQGRPDWAFRKSDLAILHGFGLPALLSSLAFALADWAAPALIVRQPHGLDQMALLSAANQWMALLVFLPVVVGRSWMPALCGSLAQHDDVAIRSQLRHATIVTALATLPLLLLLSAYSPHVMRLYGQSYQSGAQVLVLVLLGGTVMALVKPLDYLVYAAGAVWSNFLTVTTYGVFYVFGTALLLTHGVLGLVTSRFVAVLLYAVALLVICRGVLHRSRNSLRVAA